MPAKGGRIKVTLVGSRFTGKTALVSAALDQIDGATVRHFLARYNKHARQGKNLHLLFNIV